MLVIYIAFWVLLIWGLCDGDIGYREGLVYGGIWVTMLILIIFLHIVGYWFIAVTAILDIILVLRNFGGDIQIG